MNFRLLGPLEVVDDDGAALPLGGARPRALLALLLLHANEVVSVDRLIDGIWGETPPASGQSALQVHVHSLRQVLGADRIVTRPPGYLIRVEDDELDLRRFERLVEDGSLSEALALWRGPALADVAYESFAQAEAARLEESRLAALDARIAADLDAGRHTALVSELDALVAAHPHRERLRRHHMLALYRAGRQADALDSFQSARTELRELGLDPSPELRELQQRILNHDPALGLLPTEGVATSARVPELIGRDVEVASVTALLRRDDVRLVTLTGPGGTGKTTLALAAAAGVGGAEFVDLAPIADPELVLPAIGSALGIDEAPGHTPTESIAHALAGGAPTLILLDNLEHLAASFPEVAGLLDAVPTLRILATSRVPLRIGVELEYRVPPLQVPELGATDPDEVSSSAAVRLYVARAQAALPGFEPSGANIEALARITRALDGLPLAIELAAARVRVLGVEGTAKRLGEALALLVRKAPDLPERQRSLQAAIDWSVDLLDPTARHVRVALSAFPGGATLDALESVADPGTDVATALEALLDAGLALHQAGDTSEPRFDMLQTVRAHAVAERDRIDAGGAIQRRQLEWCIALADGDDPRYWLRGTAWLDRVEPELPNVRAALDFARSTGDLESEIRLASPMRHYWRVRGHMIEGRQRLEDVLERAQDAQPLLRARLQAETATLRTAAGEYAGARALWLSSLDVYRHEDDGVEIGRMLSELGTLATAEGDLDSAVAYYEQARDYFADEEFLLQLLLGNLAGVYGQVGDIDRARATALDVLDAQRHLGDRDGVAYTTFNLACFELRAQELGEAQRWIVECLDVAEEVGYAEVTAYALGVAAAVAVAARAFEDGALLLGASQELFSRLGASPQASEGARMAEVAETLNAELDDPDSVIGRGSEIGVPAAVEITRGLATATVRSGA